MAKEYSYVASAPASLSTSRRKRDNDDAAAAAAEKNLWTFGLIFFLCVLLCLSKYAFIPGNAQKE